jgi:hypothetical protein
MALSSTFGTAAVALNGTTETIVASTPFIQYVPVGAPTTYQGMVVRGALNLNPGGGTFSARVRQGTTITGTLVGGVTSLVWNSGLGVASGSEFGFEVLDTSSSPATQYTVSLFGSGAGGFGTVSTYEVEIDPVIP